MIDPALTFGSFLFAPSNRLAGEAARRVAQLPGAAYNPLVIAGAEGSGKSHLLHAIANEAQTLRPGEPASLSAANLIARSAIPSAARLLLLDDLHLISEEPEQRALLLSKCREAIASGIQVVLTHRLPLPAPSAPELDQLLSGGLLVEIEPMDRYLAAALLDRFATGAVVTLAADAADELIGRSLSPGRILGALERLRGGPGGARADLTRLDLRHALDESAVRLPAPFDEFGSFLEDVSRVVAVAVESAPWRRKLTETISRWEDAGVRTDQLEKTLHSDFPRDVESEIVEYERRAARLVQIRSELGSAAAGHILDDPERLAEVEAFYASWRIAGESDRGTPESPNEVFRTVDPWFLDPDRLVLTAFDSEGRIPGDRR